MLEELAARCAAAGFDLVAAFDVADFNAAASPDDRLTDFGRGQALGVVVGNSRALWPVFLAAPEATTRPDPLDRYTIRTLTEAARATGVPFAALWAHTLDPRPVPIQRIAATAGLAQVSPSHLSVHASFGPWIALRAVIVLDAPPPPPRPAPPHPCAGCAEPCMPALARAQGGTAGEAWPRWLAVRDACPVGRDHRYGEGQILYHYARRGLP